MIIRRFNQTSILKDLVSVQPMKEPSGTVFYLDFVYGDLFKQKNVAIDVLNNMDKILRVLED